MRSFPIGNILSFVILSATLFGEMRHERFIPIDAPLVAMFSPSRCAEKAGESALTNNFIRKAFEEIEKLRIISIVTNPAAYGIDAHANAYIFITVATNAAKVAEVGLVLRLADSARAKMAFASFAGQNGMRILPRRGYSLIAGTGKGIAAGFTDDAFILLYSDRALEVELAFTLDAHIAAASEKNSLLADQRFRTAADRRTDIAIYSHLAFVTQLLFSPGKAMPNIRPESKRFVSAGFEFFPGRVECSIDIYRIKADEELRKLPRKLDARIARYAGEKPLALVTAAFDSTAASQMVRKISNNTLNGIAERFDHDLNYPFTDAVKLLKGDCLASITKLDLDRKHYEFFAAFTCDAPGMTKLLNLIADKGVLEHMTTNNTGYYMLVSEEPGFELVYFIVRGDILFISTPGRKDVLFGAEPKDLPSPGSMHAMTENSVHIALNIDALLDAFISGGTVDAALGAQAARGKLMTLAISAAMTQDRTVASTVRAGLADPSINALTQVLSWIDAVFTDLSPSQSKRRRNE